MKSIDWPESPHRRPYPRTGPLAGPRPVVLIHGAAGSRGNFAGVVPALRAAGRPVLSVSYGRHGTRRLRANFDEVRLLLGGIVEDAGAVDLVGHSQGGLIALAASGTPELVGKVGRVVGIAGNFRGSDRPRRLPLWPVPAWATNLVGSRDLADLLIYARRSTVPVTQLISPADRVIPAARLRAVAADDPLTGTPAHRGPVDIVTVPGDAAHPAPLHSQLPYSPVVGRLVAAALEN